MAVRPKVRSQRLRELGAAGALACLGGLALLTILQFKREGADLAALKAKILPPPRAIEVVGAPAGLQERLLSFVESRGAQAASPAEILSTFPCLKNAGVSRSYLRGKLTYSVEPRKPVGTALLRGRAAGFLSDDGVIFSAPDELFEISGPALALDGASEKDLKALAVFLPQAAKAGALPAALLKMRFVSAQDGWQAELADGTSLQWGDLRFTRQKFDRLREILADAHAQFGGAAGADMRYFEDGRVLLKPMRPLR